MAGIRLVGAGGAGLAGGICKAFLPRSAGLPPTTGRRLGSAGEQRRDEKNRGKAAFTKRPRTNCWRLRLLHRSPTQEVVCQTLSATGHQHVVGVQHHANMGVRSEVGGARGVSRGEDSSWRFYGEEVWGRGSCCTAVGCSALPSRRTTTSHGRGRGHTPLLSDTPAEGGARAGGGGEDGVVGRHAATRCPQHPACTSALLFMRGEGRVAAHLDSATREPAYLHSVHTWILDSHRHARRCSH